MSEPVVIRCREHGPLVVSRAAIQLVDHQGNAFALPEGKGLVGVCRCGQSKNKPFCDGTHRTCGFQAAELGKKE